MQIVTETINCQEFDRNTKRSRPFTVVKVIFNYQSSEEDKKLLDDFIVKGTELAQAVNRGAANDSQNVRNMPRVTNNCVAGLIAEYVWKYHLNSEKEVVKETEMEDIKAQIDLKILHNDKNIEVRSSFPRNGIKFAVCSSAYQFDIIGGYSNTYKPGEVQKDFYIRTLFPFQSSQFMDKVKQDNFEVYLTGGATWSMMGDPQVAKNKHFIPEDEIDASRLDTGSSYRVVPFSNALDTVEVSELIKK